MLPCCVKREVKAKVLTISNTRIIVTTRSSCWCGGKMAAAAKTVKMSKYRPTMDQAKVREQFNGAKFVNVSGAQESIPKNRFRQPL
jgi:hypothetical protein